VPAAPRAAAKGGGQVSSLRAAAAPAGSSGRRCRLTALGAAAARAQPALAAGRAALPPATRCVQAEGGRVLRCLGSEGWRRRGSRLQVELGPRPSALQWQAKAKSSMHLPLHCEPGANVFLCAPNLLRTSSSGGRRALGACFPQRERRARARTCGRSSPRAARVARGSRRRRAQTRNESRAAARQSSNVR
jgi:hypothetical protein